MLGDKEKGEKVILDTTTTTATTWQGVFYMTCVKIPELLLCRGKIAAAATAVAAAAAVAYRNLLRGSKSSLLLRLDFFILFCTSKKSCST